MKFLHVFLTVLIFFSCQEKSSLYTITDTPWKEYLGNHRVLINVDHDAEGAYLDLEWRRHDRNPQDRKFIIVSEAGDTIANILRNEVNNERCRIVFGPVKKGLHYFYYLPFENQEGHGFYSKNYIPKEKPANKKWVDELPEITKQLANATGKEIQARTPFDSFYPMEVIALEIEKEAYLGKNERDYQLFAEDRKFPVRMNDNIPSRWLKSKQPASFSGEASRNEYYAFQIALWANKRDIENVEFEFESLKAGDTRILPTAFTCFNTDGVDPFGMAFKKQVDVPKGKVQSFWIGVDIPDGAEPGSFKGNVTVKTANSTTQNVILEIKITNELLVDRGDSQTWRHSRLRWLNSTAGIDNQPVAPYSPIERSEEGIYNLSGKKLAIGAKGMPGSIEAYGAEILNSPISFVVDSDIGIEQLSDAYDAELLENSPGVLSGSWKNSSENIEILGEGVLESDGWLKLNMKVKATRDISLKDIRLEIPFRREVATYMMGMGLPGQLTPKKHDAKWKGPQDSFWMGNVKGGLHCELRGADYTGPLLNLYRPAPPTSWHNNGKGGFRIRSDGPQTKAIVYSGARDLKAGDEVEFEFSLIITPVKKLDTKGQFTNRYYHNGEDPWPKQGEMDAKVKIINVHHANQYNPHINYPFVAVDEMKNFVDHWHNEGMKVKAYYTIRELTNYVTEIWALRSLGSEILGEGRGGGYPWLREHFIDNYYPQWYDKIDSVTVDASILTSTGDSRWFNYYVEGLKWLVENIDIDGLYLDDVSFDRHMLKRMRKVMDKVKPGCILDLHSNTGFSKGPAIQYTEFFPYLDKLWFGESFKYNEMPPENWLVEVSGIPFGHMGDMLHGGGNPWRGMVYGMTVRHPWITEGVTCDPRAIWNVWDNFGIADAKMLGYWEDDPVVTTSHPEVKATAYVKDGKMLVSIASWANDAVNVTLNIDFGDIGLDKSRVKITAPKIENFQEERNFQIEDRIPIEPAKGWLLIIE